MNEFTPSVQADRAALEDKESAQPEEGVSLPLATSSKDSHQPDCALAAAESGPSPIPSVCDKIYARLSEL